jgi:spore germination protein YaaH
MAEAREVATAAAQKRGDLPPDEVLPIQEVQYKVKLGDDLTDLAVRFGTTVASIQAANRRIVWEHSIDHIAGQRKVHDVATRM